MKVDQNFQITLPAEQCGELDIKPGDDLESLIVNSQITLRKKHCDIEQELLQKYSHGLI